MTRERLWLSDVVKEALEQGREITITEADGYGVNLEIDGEAVTETPSGDGLPWETFEYQFIGLGGPTVTRDSLELAEDILFSGDTPRCRECYRKRNQFTAFSGPLGRVELSRCSRCGDTRINTERAEQ